tara:strand:- start:146 stop:478 length:333 start_codon:yes stop_codon:yes gene_type:complete
MMVVTHLHLDTPQMVVEQEVQNLQVQEQQILVVVVEVLVATEVVVKQLELVILVELMILLHPQMDGVIMVEQMIMDLVLVVTTTVVEVVEELRVMECLVKIYQLHQLNIK